jgi:hypothetical protein
LGVDPSSAREHGDCGCASLYQLVEIVQVVKR